MRYAEVLEHPEPPNDSIYDGLVYTDNLRAAASTDVYILSGNAVGGRWPFLRVYACQCDPMSLITSCLTLPDCQTRHPVVPLGVGRGLRADLYLPRLPLPANRRRPVACFRRRHHRRSGAQVSNGVSLAVA